MANYLKLIFIVLFPTALFAQDYVYANLMMDPNQSLNIIDNPRMVEDIRGLDWDAELGVRYKRWGVYGYYGAFQEIDYQNYGVGVDYYVNILPRIETSIGVGHGIVLRQNENNDWGGFLAGHARVQATIWVNKFLGVTLKGQGQTRPLLSQTGILEGSIGLTFKSDN